MRKSTGLNGITNAPMNPSDNTRIRFWGEDYWNLFLISQQGYHNKK